MAVRQLLLGNGLKEEFLSEQRKIFGNVLRPRSHCFFLAGNCKQGFHRRSGASKQQRSLFAIYAGVENRRGWAWARRLRKEPCAFTRRDHCGECISGCLADDHVVVASWGPI